MSGRVNISSPFYIYIFVFVYVSVHPRAKLSSELHQELLALWPPIADLPFPAKRPVTGLLLGAVGVGGAVVEERIVGLEAFLHGALTLLGIYTSVDPR